KEIFGEWAKKLFIPILQSKREKFNCPTNKALLLLDGHSSRLNQDALDCLAQANVDVLTFPAHSSSILQPLDLVPFGVFKTLLSEHFHPEEGDSRAFRRNKLLAAAALCLDSSLTMLHISTAFSKPGIWPYSPQ